MFIQVNPEFTGYCLNLALLNLTAYLKSLGESRILTLADLTLY